MKKLIKIKDKVDDFLDDMADGGLAVVVLLAEDLGNDNFITVIDQRGTPDQVEAMGLCVVDSEDDNHAAYFLKRSIVRESMIKYNRIQNN